LMDLVTKKLVTPEEAYAKAVDKPVLAGMLKRVGFDPDKPAVAAAAPAAAGAAAAGAPQRPGTPRS